MTTTSTKSGSRTKQRALQLGVSLFVGAVCLWLAFGALAGGEAGSLDELTALLRSFPPSALGASLLLGLVQVVVRTHRWRVQVEGFTGRRPGFKDALVINTIAFAAVFLLPFRLGEFVRPNLCAQRGIMSASAGLAATAVERIIDGLVTTALFGALLLAAPDHVPAEVRVGGLTALLVFGGAVVFFTAAFFVRGPTLTLVERVAGLVSPSLATRLTHLVGGFLDGLACFRGLRDLATFVGLSVAFWLLNGAGIHVVLLAVVPEAPIFASLLCMCMLVLGVMLPAPPGNVGNFHAFARIGLVAAGIGMVPAMAVAVVMHAMAVVSTAGFAALAVVFGGFRLRAADLVDDR